MKNLIYICLALIILVSCSQSYEELIEGKWSVNEYEPRKDGTVDIDEWIIVFEDGYNWTERDGKKEKARLYKIEGDTLVIGETKMKIEELTSSKFIFTMSDRKRGQWKSVGTRIE